MQKKLEEEVRMKREATQKQEIEAKKAKKDLDDAMKNKEKASKDLDDAGKAMKGREAEVEDALRAMGSGEVRETKPEDKKVEPPKEEKPEDT